MKHFYRWKLRGSFVQAETIADHSWSFFWYSTLLNLLIIYYYYFFHYSFLPLGTIALVESKVDKLEGRKVFGSAELKSPDGKVTYVTANAIFIQVNPASYNKETGTKKE